MNPGAATLVLLTNLGADERDRNLMKLAASRMIGVGAESYPEEEVAEGDFRQPFELMTIGELAVMLREELADALNYAAMIRFIAERDNVPIDQSGLQGIIERIFGAARGTWVKEGEQTA